MTYFQTAAPDRPLGVVLVGAGQMGARWVQALLECDGVELVGVVDVDRGAAERVASGVVGHPAVDTDLARLLERVPVDAVVNVTVPEAHFDVNLTCLRARVPVLCEKPLVPTLREAYLLAGAAEHHSTLLAASQSRRHYRSLSALRRATALTGSPSIVTTQFFRDPHFGGFRDRMAQPLLLDMAIHAFDAARFVTGAEPVSVRCESFNPPWSWYDGDAAAVATFEMTGGLRFVYTGSWCSGGMTTSWNGSWRLSGPHGSATWDGDGWPAVELVTGGAGAAPAVDEAREEPEELAGALAEFLRALRTGETPSGDIHANLLTLAMVHAAVVSASSSGERVVIGDLLDRAHDEAVQDDDAGAVRALEQWRGARAGLIGGDRLPD